MTPQIATAVAAVVAAVLASGCSGVDELQRCIDHAVEEGVSQELAETGCRDALEDR